MKEYKNETLDATFQPGIVELEEEPDFHITRFRAVQAIRRWERSSNSLFGLLVSFVVTLIDTLRWEWNRARRSNRCSVAKGIGGCPRHLRRAMRCPTTGWSNRDRVRSNNSGATSLLFVEPPGADRHARWCAEGRQQCRLLPDFGFAETSRSTGHTLRELVGGVKLNSSKIRAMDESKNPDPFDLSTCPASSIDPRASPFPPVL